MLLFAVASHLIGLHSAFQHDAMVNGGDPDYVLIESEAEHVAQSAAHALLQSRQQCQNRGWGLLTWTGQNGTAGGPSMRSVCCSVVFSGNFELLQ